jgi:hypothetical protein
MKRIFAILFSALVLVTGMHFSFATHTCQGQMAGVKLSFSGEKASCGMESDSRNYSGQKAVSEECCHDKISFLSVDDSSNPTLLKIIDITKELAQIFIFPVSTIHSSLIQFPIISADISPPDESVASAVSLAGICIFRI